MGDIHRLCRSPEKGLRKRQFIASAGLSLFFVIFYGGCNWMTAQRADVGTIYFEWERLIPFVPILIIPYMSIDLFFVVAPFICSNRAELKTFAKRVSAGIMVACLFFMAMPLKLAVERPEVDGWLGPIFSLLHGFDGPSNLFPSLHIILMIILAHKFAQKTSGPLRTGVHIWFALIGLSTLLTYQHHFIDIAGGFFVALLLFYFIPEGPTRFRSGKNRKVGLRYAFGSLLLLGMGIITMPWGILLFWPSFSLGMVALAYHGIGIPVAGKRNGRIAFAARVVMAPWFLGHHLSRWYYKKQCRAWDAVVPGLWIGRQLNKAEAREAVEKGVTAVVDMTCEFSEPAPFRSQAYLNVQTLDLTAPTPENLDKAVDFMTREVKKGTVYVHCKIGYSRSAAAVAAYLLKSHHAQSIDEAIGMIKRARPSLIVRKEIRRLLASWKC